MMRLGLSSLLLFVLTWPPLSPAETSRLKVVVTIPPQAYFVERIAGKRADVSVMIPEGANPETYEPTPKQLAALQDADMFVQIGSPLFPAEARYRRSAKGARLFSMADGIEVMDGDPHFWTSPAAVRIIVRNLSGLLAAIDPSRRQEYERNASLFLQDIEALDAEIRSALRGKNGQTFLVFHPAWGYFAREYGLQQLALEQEGKPPSASQVRNVLDLARKKKIRAIIVQKGTDVRSARSIAADLGGEVVMADPLQRDWLDGMRRFVRILSTTLRP